MKMEFFFRGHICSVLQVVALVVCFRGNVSGEIAQGCAGSQLSLRCEDMKVIQIASVVLGDTYSVGTLCYISDKDCTHNANASHTMDVQLRCNNKQSCTVDVIRESIYCGYMGWAYNDFERITYNCTDDPQSFITAAPSRPRSTEDNLYTERNQQEKETENEGSDKNINGHDEHEKRSDNSPALVIVIACVCLIVIIAIIASVSVMVRRQKTHQVKSAEAAKASDIESDRNEAIYMNEAQGTSLNENAGSTYPIYSCVNSTEVVKSLNNGAKNFETPASDYCELLQCESEYLQLYQPLVVSVIYEQPQ